MRIKIQGCLEKRNGFERERVILKVQAVSPVGAQDIKMRNILCLRAGYSQSHNSHKLLSATLQGHDAKHKIHIHKLILSQITVIACGKSLLESSYHGKHIQYFRERYAGRKKKEKYCARGMIFLWKPDKGLTGSTRNYCSCTKMAVSFSVGYRYIAHSSALILKSKQSKQTNK